MHCVFVIHNHIYLTLLLGFHFLGPQCEDVGAKFTNIQLMLIMINFLILKSFVQ